MSNASPQNSSENSSLMILLTTILLMVALLIIYQYFRLQINTFLGWVIQAQAVLFAPFFDIPRRVLIWFDRHELDLAEQSFDTMVLLLRIIGRYFRWLAAAFGLVLTWRGWTAGAVARYRFTMTAEKLIEENSKFMPCLRPILGKKLHETDIDSGPWRAARQALQFAVENKLLLLTKDGRKVPVDENREPGQKGLVIGRTGIPREDSPCLLGPDGTVSKEFALSFDDKRAMALFKDQLGPAYEGLDSLPVHVVGLAAAFMAFGRGEKKVAQEILDQMSMSFQDSQAEDGTWTYSLDIGNAREIFERYSIHEDVEELKAAHGAFTSTFLMALLYSAKKKGILACSQYIWLRPYDRTLWYTLNQVGGKAAWAEGAGPWAHYLFEDKMGEAVTEPQCAEAVNALRYVLEQEGWLPPVVTNHKKFMAPPPEPTPPFSQNDGLNERKAFYGRRGRI